MELPILRVEQELWKLVSKYAQRRPGGARLTQSVWELHPVVTAPSRNSPGQVQQVTPRASYFSLSDLWFCPAYRAHSVFPAAEDNWEAHLVLQHETSKYIKTSTTWLRLTILNLEQVSKLQALLSTAGWYILIQQRQILPRQSGIFKYFLILTSCTFLHRQKSQVQANHKGNKSNKELHCHENWLNHLITRINHSFMFEFLPVFPA